MNKLIPTLGLTLILSGNVNAFSFDNCYTWKTKELAQELNENYLVIPNSGKCDSLPYFEQIRVRELRLEMLEMVQLLHNKASEYHAARFWQKLTITRDVNGIYKKYALLSILPK